MGGWIYSRIYHTLKKVNDIPRPHPGCHKLNSPWTGIHKLFPAWESLVYNISAGDRKMANLFYSAWKA